MFLEDVLKEYDFHCMAKGYPAKTMINKRQEYKQVLSFLKMNRGYSKSSKRPHR